MDSLLVVADSIQKLETVAPSGVRLPSCAELAAARPSLAVIREEPLESWRADVPGLNVE